MKGANHLVLDIRDWLEENRPAQRFSRTQGDKDRQRDFSKYFWSA